MSNVLNYFKDRTNGELYLGVVGAVRTGKSTFIRKFIEKKILPLIKDEDLKDKILDEIPQSGSGKTIMTVEPKFIPSNKCTIDLEDGSVLSVRLIDSVGYLINGALGAEIDGSPRYIKTPWFEEAIPFNEAASFGTEKIITTHANVGILITTDGSINDFKRKDFVDIEHELITKLKNLNKPFVVVINTSDVTSKRAQEIKDKIESTYGVKSIIANLDNADEKVLDEILSSALYEFPINELNIKVPSYLSNLDDTNRYKVILDETLNESSKDIKKFKDALNIVESLKKSSLFTDVNLGLVDPGKGRVEVKVDSSDDIYLEIVKDIIGNDVRNKGDFIKLLQEYDVAKKEYNQFSQALAKVKQTGYGISLPKNDDIILKEPEIIHSGSRYGIKLTAIAPSIHMIKVDVESTFEPIIGSEDQSKIMIDSIMDKAKDDQKNVWKQEFFGRSLGDLVNDGIKAKLYMLPENIQCKFKDTIEKVVNKGRGGIIAIIL